MVGDSRRELKHTHFNLILTRESQWLGEGLSEVSMKNWSDNQRGTLSFSWGGFPVLPFRYFYLKLLIGNTEGISIVRERVEDKGTVMKTEK